MYECVLENPFFPSNLKAPFALAVSRLHDTSTKENVTPGTIIIFENVSLGHIF